MSQDSITISAPDIYQLRHKLGIGHSPWIAIRLVGSTADPKLEVSTEDERQTFTSLRLAMSFIRKNVLKRFKRPKAKKVKREKARRRR